MFHVALCTDNSRSLHQLSVNIQRLPHPTDALEIHPFLQEYDLLRSCRQGICYNLILLGPSRRHTMCWIRPGGFGSWTREYPFP